MNIRAVVAALYIVALAFSIFSARAQLITAVLGIAICFWVYEDGANIEELNKRIAALEKATGKTVDA